MAQQGADGEYLCLMRRRADNSEVCTRWEVDQERQRNGVEEWEGERVTTKEQNVERGH